MNEPMHAILDLLDNANARMRDAVAEGQMDVLAELMEEIADLESQRALLLKEMTRPASADSGLSSGPSLRVKVISTLRLVQRPMAARFLTQVARARFRFEIDPRALASMRRDELRSFRSYMENPDAAQSKGELVVPALSTDRYTPVRGVLALSDWDLNRRLVGPSSARVDVLAAAQALAKLVIATPSAPWAPAVESLVVTIGRSLVPFAHRTETPTARMVLAAATAELEVIEPDDRRERSEAVARARLQLSAEDQLFGAGNLGVLGRRAS